MTGELLTVAETAEVLSASETQIRRWLQRGLLGKGQRRLVGDRYVTFIESAAVIAFFAEARERVVATTPIAERADA